MAGQSQAGIRLGLSSLGAPILSRGDEAGRGCAAPSFHASQPPGRLWSPQHPLTPQFRAPLFPFGRNAGPSAFLLRRPDPGTRSWERPARPSRAPQPAAPSDAPSPAPLPPTPRAVPAPQAVLTGRFSAPGRLPYLPSPRRRPSGWRWGHLPANSAGPCPGGPGSGPSPGWWQSRKKTRLRPRDPAPAPPGRIGSVSPRRTGA